MGFLNLANTNLADGVSNRSADHIFGPMGQLDPTKYHTIFDDFDPYVNSSTITLANPRYTETLDNSAISNDPSLGGAVSITTGESGGDSGIIRRINGSQQVRVGAPLYFRFRGEINKITSTTFLAGLNGGDEYDFTPTHGLYFFCANADTTLSLIYVDNSSLTQVDDIAECPVGENFTLEYYWDGVDRVYYGVDGDSLGYLDLSDSTITNEGLAHAFGIQTNEAIVKGLTVDYMFSAQERES